MNELSECRETFFFFPIEIIIFFCEMLKNVPGHGVAFKVDVNFIPFLALTHPALATADLVHMAATRLSQKIQCHMFVLGKKGDGDRNAWTPSPSKRELKVTDGEEGKEKLFSILSPSV